MPICTRHGLHEPRPLVFTLFIVFIYRSCLLRWLPHSVLQIGEKYVIVFSCSCYFFSTNLFNQLLCSTNQPTILFMPSPTVATIQSIFQPTLSSANNSFPPFIFNQFHQPFRFFYHLAPNHFHSWASLNENLAAEEH